MSANYPPPQQQPGGNPYGQQQPQPYGQPPYGAPQQPGFPGGYPPPAPVRAARDNVGLGILVGLAAALVAALAYGGILRALSSDDGTKHEFRLMAIGVGALVGLAVGKAGGRNAALPFLGVLFALAAVVLGELFGNALVISHYVSSQGGELSVSDIFLHHFSDLFKTWKHDFGFMRFLFLLFAAIVSFGVSKRLGDNS